MNKPVNLDEAYSSFDERWSPRIIAQVNDYDVKVVHVAGEFTWHDHPETDEFFMVTKGRLTIRLGDPDQASQVVLTAGDVYVVSRGVRHCPLADEGTQLLLFEPRGTANTGEASQGTVGVPI